MKLSQAILKGCEMSPTQLRGQLLGQVSDGWGSCALGAAYLGVYGPPQPGEAIDMDEGLQFAFPILSTTPNWSISGLALYGHIVTQNDERRMTREAIAADLAEKGL